VFLSYSRLDEAWKDRVSRHLSVLTEEGLLDVWDDRRIGAGADWEAEIRAAMNAADVAILLVSADLLTSRFIRDSEVPQLLRRRAKSQSRHLRSDRRGLAERAGARGDCNRSWLEAPPSATARGGHRHLERPGAGRPLRRRSAGSSRRPDRVRPPEAARPGILACSELWSRYAGGLRRPGGSSTDRRGLSASPPSRNRCSGSVATMPRQLPIDVIKNR